MSTYSDAIDLLLRSAAAKALNYREYTPAPGERWDNIAAATEVYSNAYSIELLKRFNPQYANMLELGPETPIRIPLIEVDQYVNPNSLPPWDPRRAALLSRGS